MTNTAKTKSLPEQCDIMRQMALDMNVALYRRYDSAAVAKTLGMTEADLDGLREQGQIGFLALANNQVGFFGCHLLEYLLDCVVPRGSEPRPEQTSAPQMSQPTVHPEAKMLALKDVMMMLGVKRTKLNELTQTGRIKTVRLDGRVLVKREELDRFIASLDD